MPADYTVRKVLVATDGSPASFAAISDLVHAGLPPEGEAVVLSIADRVPLFPPRTPEEILYLEDARLAVPRHWARSAADILRRRFPQWVVREETRAGAPAREILKFADEWSPDLIVLGSHGRSTLGRLFFGSVSRKVMLEARAAVRIGRRLERPDSEPLRILVGVDETPASEVVVAALAARHFPPQTQVKLVTATGVFEYFSSDILGSSVAVVPSDTIDELRRTAAEAATAVQEKLLAAYPDWKVTLSREVIEGDPKSVLLDIAEKWPADAIMLGTRDLSGAERFFIGSVSSAIVAHAPCTVEVIRRRRDEADSSTAS
ncbi:MULTISPECIES: universal stress protein [Chloracidobacterium]|jgi:nucleotide-binding universal stress UspA family protein|uniref:Universal stress protein UspA-like nucleotide-binding protein n=1 Tax=Chloracidobacterium thermophilum (strain B) TaxID=981222 RepID=G2LLF9_CHLTF|nr:MULTISPECIES: universal stress protein [Chloracidobacterium]AEP13434.1 Universal stress protein UspA-like nucleotide-binding protein [Chloracidobacterium thermophilum B]QUV79904.1 universal stress protein [Chloracidobacterium thermophilum]QUV83525.1 universal stress protein [Chloracidobacterium sp. D]